MTFDFSRTSRPGWPKRVNGLPEQGKRISTVDKSLLARVRLWTILVATACSLALWLAVSTSFALGVFITALWATAGLFVLEKLLRAAILPPDVPRNGFAVILWGLAKIGLYALAVPVLIYRPFPALSHAVGFTLLMVVLTGCGARARAAEIAMTTGRGEDG